MSCLVLVVSVPVLASYSPPNIVLTLSLSSPHVPFISPPSSPMAYHASLSCTLTCLPRTPPSNLTFCSKLLTPLPQPPQKPSEHRSRASVFWLAIQPSTAHPAPLLRSYFPHALQATTSEITVYAASAWRHQLYDPRIAKPVPSSEIVFAVIINSNSPSVTVEGRTMPRSHQIRQRVNLMLTTREQADQGYGP